MSMFANFQVINTSTLADFERPVDITKPKAGRGYKQSALASSCEQLQQNPIVGWTPMM